MKQRGCTFKEAARSSPEELRIAAVLERIGWSDEVEVLANIRADILAKLTGKQVRWEDCLPFKYQAAANYSIVKEQSQADIDVVISQITSL